jgi:hypothetical protein
MDNPTADFNHLELYRAGLVKEPSYDPAAFEMYQCEKDTILNWFGKARIIAIVSGTIPEKPACMQWYTRERLAEIISEAFGVESRPGRYL